jgi:hypothetical protein
VLLAAEVWYLASSINPEVGSVPSLLLFSFSQGEKNQPLILFPFAEHLQTHFLYVSILVKCALLEFHNANAKLTRALDW